MKELIVISGKGGTGKTSLTACMAVLAKDAVLVDCDVDAADLHLILKPIIKEQVEFKSGQVADINNDVCIACGECKNSCRFSAVVKTKSYIIDQLSCEGCKVCQIVCPVNAISMHENICGSWYVSETRCGTMVHAALRPGSENSGKLVSIVRQKAKEIAENNETDLIIIDGPPGIGCPVIASIGGATLALIVTEPTKSGIHDLKRIAELTRHFKVPTCVCINKFDLNYNAVREVEIFCKDNQLKVIGKIPYDLDVTKAMVKGLSAVEFMDNSVSKSIKAVWDGLNSIINKQETL